MTALTRGAGAGVRQAKLFRPYRDVRFAKDKTPYKTHQGAFVAGRRRRPAGTSRSAPPGVRVGVGFYDAGSPRLAAFRAAVDDDRTGAELEQHRRPDAPPGLGARRRDAQDHAARVRRRPPAHRPAAAQVDDVREVLRLRAGDPHRRPARPGPRRLAGRSRRSSSGSTRTPRCDPSDPGLLLGVGQRPGQSRGQRVPEHPGVVGQAAAGQALDDGAGHGTGLQRHFGRAAAGRGHRGGRTDRVADAGDGRSPARLPPAGAAHVGGDGLLLCRPGAGAPTAVRSSG